MPSFGSMVNRQLMLLLLMAAGVLAEKLGLLGEETRGKLSDLLVKVLMPCSVLSSFWVEHFDAGLLRNFLLALVVGFALEIGCYFLARGVYGRRANPDERAVLQYGIVSPNASFIGMPVISGFYGAEGLLYLSAFLIPANVFLWGVGLTFFQEKGNKVRLKTILLQPIMAALALGTVMLLTGLRPPVFIGEAVVSLGNCTTPVAMLIIGGILAGVPLKSVFSKVAFGFCGLRLVVIPLALLAVLWAMRLPPVLSGSMVVEAGLPIAVSSAVLATSYNKNPALASKLMFLSTVGSMLTLPLLATLVSVLF